MRISEDMLLADIIKQHRGVLEVLRDLGLMCTTCPVLRFETVKDAAKAHGIDTEFLVNRLSGCLPTAEK